MLLPSGNDAAILLSQLIGLLINLHNRRKLAGYDLYNPNTVSEDLNRTAECNIHQKTFLSAMNDKARVLGTTQTIFSNPHGNDAFETEHNLSTAVEVGRLSFSVLDNS